MKIRSLVITALVTVITGLATPGMSQPELVCIENGIERKVEGFEKVVPYYTDNGEKKIFPKERDCFLKKNNDDFLSWGYPTLNYIVKPDKEGQFKAASYIDDKAGKHVWGKITNEALLKIWNDDSINNAKCFMAWYEP